tara:strand:+ start:12718 stop:13806 length:1089 start_codon:yes stop_codon:yes gene_type:complete
MNILLFGYGFYVLGNEDLSGGTIMPSIMKWQTLSKQNVTITCLVKNSNSKLKAIERFKFFCMIYNCSDKIKIFVKSFDEYKLEKLFDCSILAAPEKYHLEILKFATSSSKEIICVKPFTENENQVFEALKLARDKKVNIFIDFHKRFDNANIEFIKNASVHEHNDGIFNFSYGQKVEMPLKYFKQWSIYSNPFQYLAPHYLDIILQVIKNSGANLQDLNISGSAECLKFKENPSLISLISCNIKLSNKNYCYLINAICNWMEPKMSPFNSRQRIEFQTNSLHLISEQDNRGQLLIKDDTLKIPNPHFMTTDCDLLSSGYGVDSYCNFFNYILGMFPRENLVSIDNYLHIAKIIDFVNQIIKK